MFDVDGGDLTIKGQNTAKVTAKSGVGSTCAVWVHNGGRAVINGGHYSVGADKDGLRNDCIYAGSKSEKSVGTIIINRGEFEYTGTRSTENAKNGDLFLINCFDGQKSLITVNGGTFKNHVPSIEPTGAEEVKLGDNRNVYKSETDEKVTVAHSGSQDVWYTVK